MQQPHANMTFTHRPLRGGVDRNRRQPPRKLHPAVAPFAGAWIKTCGPPGTPAASRCRPLRGGVDRNSCSATCASRVPTARGPLGDDPQAAAEAGEAETPPELGPVAASAGPSFVELDEPGLERAHADTEDVVALAAENASDGLPAAAGPQDDLLDRHAIIGERPDSCVHLLAAQEALVLQPLG